MGKTEVGANNSKPIQLSNYNTLKKTVTFLTKFQTRFKILVKFPLSKEI